MPKKTAKTESLAKMYNLKTVASLKAPSFISSGIPEIDAITGGLPVTHITEIYGNTGVGKTSLTLKCISALSQKSKVLFVDAENAINTDFLTKEANMENIDLSREYILEEVAALTIQAVDEYDVIVVDSVASLLPRPEADGEMGDQLIGIKARLMGKWTRKLLGPLSKSNCTFLFINQVRESPSMYVPKFIPGGNALPFSASLRIELTSKKADRIIKDDVGIGHKVTAEVVKSRFSPPFQKTSFTLSYTQAN